MKVYDVKKKKNTVYIPVVGDIVRTGLQSGLYNGITQILWSPMCTFEYSFDSSLSVLEAGNSKIWL